MKYNFSFANIGGATRVKIHCGEDIRHLGELDQKMWTVLSCPTSGLEIDEKSLQLMDLDHDGQLHVSEVVRNAEWLCSVLRDPQVLFAETDSLSLHDIADETIHAVAAHIAGDKEVVSLADVEKTIAEVTVESTQPTLKSVDMPYEEDVIAAYNEKKESYAEYYRLEKLQKIGLASIPEEMPKPGMSEAAFLEMGAKITEYEKIVAENDAAKAEAETADAAAMTAKREAFVPLQKLLLLSRDFCHLLRNFVTLDDFYNKDVNLKAIFQAGVLVIDQRMCHLCMRVEDMGKHDTQAGASGMFLIYCDCTNKVLGKTMKIVAAMTIGEIRNLKVGKNAIFYDRAGNDWDAVVTKVVDNPISIRQAFWSPYRKFANWVTELINKTAAEKDSQVLENMKAEAQTEVESAKSGKENDSKKTVFDIAKFAGIFAAFGIAIGYVGSFFTSLAIGINSLKWWQLIIWIIGLILLISGPAMVLAWVKLRKRNIAPLLNANGWAVNADSIVNVMFGATLTEMVQFPLLQLEAKRKMATWKKWLISVAAIVVVVVSLWLANCFSFCHVVSPLPVFQDKEVVADSMLVQDNNIKAE